MTATILLSLASVWVYTLLAVIAQRRGFTAEIWSALGITIALWIFTNMISGWEALPPPGPGAPFFAGLPQPVQGGYFFPESTLGYWGYFFFILALTGGIIYFGYRQGNKYINPPLSASEHIRAALPALIPIIFALGGVGPVLAPPLATILGFNGVFLTITLNLAQIVTATLVFIGVFIFLRFLEARGALADIEKDGEKKEKEKK